MSTVNALQLRRELARRDLLEYTQTTFDGNYLANWHHRLICEELERVARFETRKLIITTPPRMGKSELVSRRFPAWFLSRAPSRQLILATHSMELSARMTRDVQRVLDSPAHQDIFPAFDYGDRKSSKEFTTDQGGVFKPVGVGTGIAGFGGHIGIIDDYFANREEAESRLKRDRLWEWYTDDFVTRLMWPSAQIVMATRWHEDDLIGRILETANPGEWRVIHLPFIQDDPDPPDYDPRDEGDPLWPGFFGDPEDDADEDELKRRAVEFFEEKRRRNSYGTEALYQGRPTPREGGLFNRTWFPEYDEDPRRVHDMAKEVVISVDAAFKKTARSDPVSVAVFAKVHDRYYLLDEDFGRKDFPETVRAVERMKGRWSRAKILIEDKANGPAVISKLEKRFKRVVPFEPGKNSKEARASTAAETIEAEGIHVPPKTRNPWVSDWLEDIVGYPGRKHDDRVDSLTQTILHWESQSDPVSNLRRVLGM